MIKGIRTVSALIALCGALAPASHFHPANAQPGSTQLRILKPPANGVINVAFIVSDQIALIDLAGPWEVFGDVMFTRDGPALARGRRHGHALQPVHRFRLAETDLCRRPSGGTQLHL